MTKFRWLDIASNSGGGGSEDLRLGTGQSTQLVCPGGENPKWYNQIHTYNLIINYSSEG